MDAHKNYQLEAEEQRTLDFWAMKNMETAEYDGETGMSSWSEWDKVTD